MKHEIVSGPHTQGIHTMWCKPIGDLHRWLGPGSTIEQSHVWYINGKPIHGEVIYETGAGV